MVASRCAPVSLVLLLAACIESPSLEGRSCDLGHPCPDAFVCSHENVCRPRCRSSVDCQSGATCTGGACVPGAQPTDACADGCGEDAGWADADPADAGATDVGPDPQDAGETPDAVPGDTGSADAGTVVDAATDAGMEERIEGIRILDHVVDQQVVSVPQDLTGDTISATFHDGSGFQTVTGQGTANGTFEIEGVPLGPYLLRWTDFLFVTSERTVDLGRPVLGRPGRTQAQSPMELTLTADGLAPWAPGDGVWVSSPELGAWTGNVHGLSSDPTPTAGATSIQVVMDYALGNQPWLIQANAGDRAFVTQLVRDEGPPISYAVRRAAEVGNLVMTNGTPAQLTATLSALPLVVFDLDWRASAFEGVAPEVHPDAVLDQHYVRISPVPGGLVHGFYGYMSYVLHVTRPAEEGVVEGLTFGNPYTGSDLVVRTHTELTIPYELPRATPMSFRASFLQLQRLSDVVGAVHQPLLSPPRSLQINGMPADVDRTGVSTTPVLSWSPPTSGAPDMYRVLIHRLFVSGVETQSSNTWTIYTRSTTLQIPPGLLTGGDVYFFEVEARIIGGVDVEQTPFVRALPYAEAAAFTRTVAP